MQLPSWVKLENFMSTLIECNRKEKPRVVLTNLPTVSNSQRTRRLVWVNGKIYNLIKRKEIAQLMHRLMDSRWEKKEDG